MRLAMRFLPALVAGVLWSSSGAVAQCTVVPGTGCPNTSPTVCSGSATLGGSITLGCPPSIGSHLVVVGQVASSPVPLPASTICGGGGGAVCTLGCTTIAVLRGGPTLQIPTIPSLRNLTLCAQCVIWDFNRNCVVPVPAVSFTIT